MASNYAYLLFPPAETRSLVRLNFDKNGSIVPNESNLDQISHAGHILESVSYKPNSILSSNGYEVQFTGEDENNSYFQANYEGKIKKVEAPKFQVSQIVYPGSLSEDLITSKQALENFKVVMVGQKSADEFNKL
jgi:hypothetical protein